MYFLPWDLFHNEYQVYFLPAYPFNWHPNASVKIVHIIEITCEICCFSYVYIFFFLVKVSLGLFSVLFLWFSVWWLVKWGLTDRVVLKGDNWWAIAFQLLRPWSPSPDGLDLPKGKIKGTRNVQSQEETGPKYSYT